jgi:sterol desaturase/sphingolipid hydroxylase (fatty acid hydroxylase superfamily)
MDLRALAVLLPFFLACVLAEVVVLALRARRLPDAGESLANVGCGVAQLAMRPLYETAVAGLYLAVYERHRVFTLSPASPLAWLALFLAADLTYYGYHRMSHRVAVMWAWHGVHHQSPTYDLSVSLRLSWLGGPIERLFYLPFAALGFAPAMIVAVTGASSFYQFFVHTRVVGRLGPAEWVLNTPSNHRVHHGVEARYVDKNFGGVLCVWDRLFGTFVPEGEEPTYGVARPFESRSPATANGRYWTELLAAATSRGLRLRARLALLLGPPSAVSAPARAPLPPLRPALALYVAAQLGACALVVCALCALPGLPPRAAAVGVVFACASALSLGALLDGRRWGVAAEVLRWSLALGGAAWLGGYGRLAWVVQLGVLLASAGSLACLVLAAPRNAGPRGGAVR